MTNRIRKNVGTLAVAVGLFAMAGAGSAAVAEIEIRTAPPPDRVEMVPPARKTELLKTYWTVPDRQIETSVVLANPPFASS